MAKKKPGRKPKRKVYFGMEVQDAIIRYNDTDNPSKKNKIYQEEIHKAFDKLCENIINTFKFTYFDDPFEDVKNEVISFLVMNMHKYDHTKGSKAFSYFSVVAKNYLILHNNNNYKKLKSHKDISVLEHTRISDGKGTYLNDFTDEMIQYFEDTIPNIFKKKRDIDIANSIVELLRRRDEIENFNKKSLYILIREMTNVNTTHITNVVNTLKKHYHTLVNEFYTNGSIHNHKTSSFF
tara:strand:+ start:111 stop:821 length:711 start_codon:yes stop_codon:yes gene_type:complete